MTAVIRCMECQMGSPTYIPCLRPAVGIVYWDHSKEEVPMCEMCADHNTRNRDAKLKPIPAGYRQPVLGDNNPPQPVKVDHRLVDQLGTVKAQIAELEEKEKAIRDQIVAWGLKEVEGDMFRATVSTAERAGRDAAFKAKIEELIEEHLSAQYVRAHTTATPVTSVRIAARKGVGLKVLGD